MAIPIPRYGLGGCDRGCGGETEIMATVEAHSMPEGYRIYLIRQGLEPGFFKIVSFMAVWVRGERRWPWALQRAGEWRLEPEGRLLQLQNSGGCPVRG
jgi:hypothetical protein